ncbi:PfkB family carbohydrate kinase [Streptomyces sp. NPDC093085]|uniref:carbohydrate kinase family protein n=1 Tax=Streptomyces sp. NPDC093085 TaxID=3155068 RepID=UPI00342209CE
MTVRQGHGRPGAGLLVIGDVVTDVVARYRTPLARGTDTAAEIRTLPGGAGANAACWAARSGCADVRLLAGVGADARDWHAERLRRAGVRARLVLAPGAATATVVSLVDATAERTLLTDSGAALRLPRSAWSPELLDGVGRLHLSGYLFYAATSRAVALAALERGVPVSVDPASAGFLRTFGPERFLAAVEGVETVLPNADEARALTGLADPARAAAALSTRTRVAVVTRGGDGALVAERGAVTARIAALPARALDSTGAGDAFTGAYLAARLRGASPVRAAEAGCRAGAQAVRIPGGRPQPE